MVAQRLRRVLVTGAEGVLGAAVAAKLIDSGVEVLGTCHRDPGVARPGLKWLKLDLADAAAVRAARAELSAVDGWIHCAGGFRWAKADEIGDAELEFLISANLKSALLLAREILPGMKSRGFGRIVLVSSRATIQPPGAGMGAYAATKAGLNQIVLSLAEEVRSLDINVNAILPSMIDTPANRKDMPQADFSAWVRPAQLAEIVYSLTQPWGDPIHGALIPVSGRI
jgi:NAD(P)-dependent dehydrogenase (short-subunit alcohol dehydrogenase family)